MKCIQAFVVAMLLQFLHIATTSAYSQRSQTNFCRTLYGKKSVARVPTESVLTTRCTTTTVVVKVTPTSTVTPTPVTTTKTSTKRVTSTTSVTKAPKTATVTSTATNTISSTQTLTSTVNTVVTVTTTTTSTQTIAPSAGFVPVNPNGDLRKRIGAAQPASEPSKEVETYDREALRIGAAPSYARTVYCTRSVVQATSVRKTSTAPTFTTILDPKTSTATQVTTSTKTVTKMPAGAVTTRTVTTTTDVTSYTSTTVTTSATATATQLVIVPDVYYSGCGATNQLSILAGNAFAANPFIGLSTVAVNDAYDCCVACMQTTNCALSFLAPVGGLCTLLSTDTCVANNLNVGSYNLVKGSPSYILSNSNCGSWDRFLG